jgi:hypothetical protein
MGDAAGGGGGRPSPPTARRRSSIRNSLSGNTERSTEVSRLSEWPGLAWDHKREMIRHTTTGLVLCEIL